MGSDPFPLLRSFWNATVPRREWTHHAHIRVATFIVRTFGQALAHELLRAKIRTLNAALGGPAAAYHETVTHAWTIILDAALRDRPIDASLARECDEMVETVGQGNHLGEYYSAPALTDRRARNGFARPDLRPLPKPVGLHIRSAAVGEGPHAASVVREVYDEYGFTWDEGGYHADLVHIESHYLSTGDIFLVAVDTDGTLVGTAALKRFAALPGEQGWVGVNGVRRIAGADGSVERLYVRPRARRCGIGRALLSRITDVGRVYGMRRLEIWSDKRFQEAHRLYRSLGADIVSSRICGDPDQSPEWGLRLNL